MPLMQDVVSQTPSMWLFSTTGPWLALTLAIFATVLFSIIIAWVSMSMCACCGRSAERRHKMLQAEADAAVPPPPEAPSQSVMDFSIMDDTQLGEGATKKQFTKREPTTQRRSAEKEIIQVATRRTTKKKPSEKEGTQKCPIKKGATEKRPIEKAATQKKPTEKEARHDRPKIVKDEPTEFVPKSKLAAYRTLRPADSAVFDKPDRAVPDAGYLSLMPRQNRKQPTSTSKYVPKENVALYRTLNLADSHVFDKTRTIKDQPTPDRILLK